MRFWRLASQWCRGTSQTAPKRLSRRATRRRPRPRAAAQVRGADDHSRAKVNGAPSVEEKWRHDTIDQLFALAGAFHEE
eukprot:1772110-Pyramimonas_sp.AAC.1